MVGAGLRRDWPRREHLHALGCARGYQTVRYTNRWDLQHKNGLAFANQCTQRRETGEAVIAWRGGSRRVQ
jgi:hypothetical protein